MDTTQTEFHLQPLHTNWYIIDACLDLPTHLFFPTVILPIILAFFAMFGDF